MILTSARQVILKPVVSEKSYGLIDASTYTFIVHPDANKIEIRQAVEEIWKVKVVSVNTMSRKGKTKRNRGGEGKRPGSKRAIVKLAEGNKIELFETR
ncbi:MAG: 50S ribosomal protein L23 [Actinomycetota bacterium]